MRDERPLSGILLVQAFLVALSGLLLWWSWQPRGDLPGPEQLVSSLFTLHAAWAFFSWRLATGRYMDGYTLFLLATLLFSGGQVLLASVGLLPDGPLDHRFGPQTMQRTIALVGACVSSMHLGALLVSEHAASRPARPARDPARDGASSRLRTIGLLFLAVSVVPVAMRTFRMTMIVVDSGYFGLYQQEAKVGLQNWDAVLAGFFLPGVLILLATSGRRKLPVRVAWGLAIASTVVNMFLGARAAALLALVPMLLLHHQVIRPIRARWGAVLVAAGLAVIPLVGELRGLTLEKRLAPGVVLRTQSEIPLVSALQEMGGSMETVAHAIELVPARRGLDEGAGYVGALLTALPNLFWDVHPGLAAGSYSQWLMNEVDPDLFRLGGGIGFSMIAEAYVNASWFGAPIFTFLVGLLVSALVAWSRATGAPLRLAIEAIVVSTILVLPRGEMGMIVRPLVWTAAVPYLLARAAIGRREPAWEGEPGWRSP